MLAYQITGNENGTRKTIHDSLKYQTYSKLHWQSTSNNNYSTKVYKMEFEVEDEFSDYIYESGLYDHYEAFMYLDDYEKRYQSIKSSILTTTLIEIDSLNKKQIVNKPIPRETLLLGERFNRLYKSWYLYLGYLIDPDSETTTDLPDTDTLIAMALSELKMAKLINDNYFDYQCSYGEEKKAYGMFTVDEYDRWRVDPCEAHLLLEHLYTKDRLPEIIKANDGLGPSLIYTSPDLLPDALMIALGLAKLADANKIAAQGHIGELADSIYEVTQVQKIVAKSLSKKLSASEMSDIFSINGRRGASVRANKFDAVRSYAIELSSSMEGKSANQIAYKIKDLVMIKARSLNASLSEENAQKTIQKYILAHRNKSL